MRLSLLGCWQFIRDGEKTRVAFREQRVLTLLAMEGPLERRRVAGLLWPETIDSRALDSLRVSVHRISRTVPGVVVATRNRLGLAETVRVDLHDLRENLARLPCPSNDLPPGFVHFLRSADLLPGWDEPWLQAEQDELLQRRIQTLETIAVLALQHQDTVRALEAAEAVLALEPLSERAACVLAQAHAGAGNHAVAAAGLNRFIRRLGEELGLGPTPELLNTLTQVRAGSASAALRDIGRRA
jgi:DNA-binding SARP family transcriptional activator